MHMPDFYFEQLVTEAFLDMVFGWAEDADLAIRQDVMNPLDGSGNPKGAIHRGGVVSPTTAPSMAVKVSPIYATDPDGRRIYFPDEQQVDCTLDYLSVATAVGASGNEKYLAIFAQFDRELTEQKIDGNGVPVWTQQLESFSLKVYQGDEVTSGSAVPPATPAGMVRCANILLVYNQTQILTTDIEDDTTDYERDDWIRLVGSELGEFTHGSPSEAIEELFGWLDDVSGGGATFVSTTTWHDGNGLGSTVISAAINEIVADLATATGSDKVGAAAHTTTGNYCDLAAGSVQDQMRTVADNVDGHIDGGAPAHASDAVTSVAIAGTPSSISIGDVLSQLTEVLDLINNRMMVDSGNIVTGGHTFNADQVFAQLLQLYDEDAYIQGDETTSGHYFPIFKHLTLRGGLYYSGTTGGIFLAYNCYWDSAGAVWKYHIGTDDAYVLGLSQRMILYRLDKDETAHAPAGWTDSDWNSGLEWGGQFGSNHAMPALPKAVTLPGSILYDRAKAALFVNNPGSDVEASGLSADCGVTWHAYMGAAVSGDISLSVDSQSGWSVNPGIVEVDAWGCVLSGTTDSIAADAHAHWRGIVTAEVTV